MTTASENLQVLLVAPIGRDAELIANALRISDVQSEVLKDIGSAVEILGSKDVGALLLAEEALDQEAIDLLALTLKNQPPWSTLPILILTAGGKESLQSGFQERQRSPLGNATLLERPIRVATLVSSVKAALSARSGQYQRGLATAALRESEKLAAVGRLASSIAHEINNPLEAVTNVLYLLDGTPLNTEQRGYLDIAQRELGRVAEIGAQTLTFNRQRDIRGQASISALLDSVLVLYQGRLSGSKTMIERRYQNTAPFTCYPGELRQVFANLIGNAFDATRKGGRIILRERAGMHRKSGQHGVWITLADTGHGISAEVKTQLFEPFKSTKLNGGNGLGLWISKGIIEKHRGSIRVRSSTKSGCSGTAFSIFIPIE